MRRIIDLNQKREFQKTTAESAQSDLGRQSPIVCMISINSPNFDQIRWRPADRPDDPSNQAISSDPLSEAV